ncbi:hypothetical protein GCM10025886_24030 [Tetragenococcus halophilus subsp. flandriensis]|uniref:GNAT family N-acetyltransferase n=1 Tax=Tetragenococcus halophilus TaxID=51669 RepID=UPI0023E977A7|nr:GNAT family N-acetyltransferase [Tetragenococcus halophilus]GMA09251.1 hypothetical protein GCM10025886_24030 [Tetragenococcus halophilus subsp. flandriensis]
MAKIIKRLATIEDLSQVLNLIEDGKNQMKTNGVTQWNRDYPASEIVESDIRQKKLWLYGKKAEACVTVSVKGETVNIHRLVVSSLYKEQGLAKLILQDILDCTAINKQTEQEKVVTNHSNQSMIRLLTSKKFIPTSSFKADGREDYGSFIEFKRKL